MRAALFIAAAIAVATASPNGYYHQEYNYKTSASSYRNNELQHKTDDQGYYRKDGDLEGRVKPKVSSNSEHSEYVNPRSHDQADAAYYDAGSDFNSHGNMLANSYGASVGGRVASGYQAGTQYENNLNSEGLASSDYIGAASGYSGAYSSGSEAAYESANLRTIGSSLQTDLQRELQSALLSRAHQVDVAELEAEIHRNLTARLNDILQEKFGTQTIRGGQSYTLSGGRLQTRPNYEQRELEQLQRQIERGLVQELRQGYNYRTSQSSHQTVNQIYERFESTTTYRPQTYTYQPIYPNLNTITNQNKYVYGGSSVNAHRSEYETNRAASNVQFTQVPNAVSITTLASNVQSELNERLNRILEAAQRQYFSENSRFDAYSTAPILDRLKDELRRNLTYSLDEELRRNFGTQLQKNGYMFTVLSNGESTNQYNYNVADLENLRRQVEENLITKLTRDFEAARQHWITRQQHAQSMQNVQSQQQHVQSQQHAQSQQDIYRQTHSGGYNYIPSNNLGYEYSTPRHTEDDYYRPTAASIIPLISSGIKGGHHQIASGSHVSNYQSAASNANIAQLQRQLQTDLGNQLQAALTQNRAYSSRYSGAGGGQAGFDDAYRRLYEELQRNLTQQLQSFQSGSSAYSNSYGDVSQNQLAQLRAQLQDSLSSQLQQGLRQSYSASASYSASSGSSASAGSGAYSSSNTGGYYRPARGSNDYGYGQYRSGAGYLVEGEDCQEDDPLARQYYRAKRSYGYRSRPLGLSTQTGGGYNSGGTYGGYPGYGNYQPVGQESDDSEIIQPNQGSSNQNVGQEIDETDDRQRIEIDRGFGVNQPPTSGGQRVGQTEDDSDTQQIQVDHGFSSIGLGSQNAQLGLERASNPTPEAAPTRTNQRPLYRGTGVGLSGGLTDTSTTPRSNIWHAQGYGNQNPIGQEEDDSDDTQQLEVDQGFSSTGLGSDNLQLGSRTTSTTTKPATPEIGEPAPINPNIRGTLRPFGYSRYYNQPTQSVPVGQEEDESDSVQPIDNNRNNTLGNIEVGNTRRGQQQEFTGIRQIPYSGSSNIDTTHQNTWGTNNRQIYSGYRRYIPTSSERPFVRRITEANLIGQQEDKDDTQQVEIDDGFATANLNNQNSQNNEPDSSTPFSFQTGVSGRVPGRFEISSTPTTTTSSFTPVNPNPGYIKPLNVGQQEEDFDSDVFERPSTPNQLGLFTSTTTTKPTPSNQFGIQNSVWTSQRPTLASGGFRTQPTPKDQLLLQFGTQNVIPETETVASLWNNYDNSWPPLGTTTSQRPIIGNPVFNIQPVRPAEPQWNYPYNIQPTEPIYANALPTSQVAQSIAPTTPQIDIPVQLKDVSRQLEADLTNQIKNVIKNDLPFSSTPDQLYLNALYNLRTNITRECQRVLEESRYYNLNIYQTDITKLEKYIESHLIQKLNEEFRIAGYVRPVPTGYQPGLQQSPSINTNYYGINRGQYGNGLRPQTSSTSFIQREIDAQDNKFQENQKQNSNRQIEPVQFGRTPNLTPVLPLESGSSVNPNVLPQTPVQPILGDVSSTTTSQRAITELPLPTLPSQSNNGRRNFNQAENEADALIERLRNSIRNREGQNPLNPTYQNVNFNRPYDSTNNQPQNGVIRVKLENLTPEQFNIITQIENDYTNIINVAVHNEYASTIFDHTSKYELYQTSVNRLERELRRNITACIEGRVQNWETANLQTYFNLLHQKFEQQKIADVQKYLEIKLIKKIRAELKKLYNIEAIEETPSSGSIPDVTHQKPRYEPRVVRLENITPAQLKVIKQIEEEINAQIEAAIQVRITNLRASHTSSYFYQQSLTSLEAELKNNITESVQRLCEPGLSQYSQLVATNFDSSKIRDLEQYLEVRLTNKLRENLTYYSTVETTVNSQFGYHSTSSLHNSDNTYSHSGASAPEPVNVINPDLSNPQPPQVIPPSPGRSSVKGGSNKYLGAPQVQTPDESASYINPDAELVPKVTNEITNNLEPTEPTTPAESWWTRTGKKVKQAASKLKDKITGRSSEPDSQTE